MVLDLRDHLRVLGQFLIAGIGDVVPFGPIPDGGQVDIDKGGAIIAAIAEDDRFQDVWIELQFVLDIFGGEQPPVGHFSHILGAVDDPQMSGAFFDKACVARRDPAIRILGRCRALGILIVFDEHTGRPIKHLARISDPDFHARRGHANGVGAHLVVGLLGDKDAGFGLTIKLLQVDPQRPVEIEDLGPDGLACGVADPDAGKAQRILQRTVDQKFAQPIRQPILQRYRLVIQNGGPDPTGHRHVTIKHPFLEGPSVFHPDHDIGQLGFEDAWRGKVVGRADLAQIGHHGVGGFRAVHAEPCPIGLPDREDEIAHPSHRQIGQNLVFRAQLVEGRTVLGGFDDVVVRQNHTLRFSRGARRIKHHAGIFGGLAFQPFGKFGGVLGFVFPPFCLHDLKLGQLAMIVFPHAARIEIDHMVQTMQTVLNLENLVDLFLVRRHNEAGPAVVQNIGDFFTDRVLIQRHGNCPDHLRRHHGPVKIRSVAPDNRDVIALLRAQFQKPQRQGTGFALGFGPSPALPDPVFLFAIRGLGCIDLRIARHEARNGIQRTCGR